MARLWSIKWKRKNIRKLQPICIYVQGASLRGRLPPPAALAHMEKSNKMRMKQDWPFVSISIRYSSVLSVRPFYVYRTCMRRPGRSPGAWELLAFASRKFAPKIADLSVACLRCRTLIGTYLLCGCAVLCVWYCNSVDVRQQYGTCKKNGKIWLFYNIMKKRKNTQRQVLDARCLSGSPERPDRRQRIEEERRT